MAKSNGQITTLALSIEEIIGNLCNDLGQAREDLDRRLERLRDVYRVNRDDLIFAPEVRSANVDALLRSKRLEIERRFAGPDAPKPNNEKFRELTTEQELAGDPDFQNALRKQAVAMDALAEAQDAVEIGRRHVNACELALAAYTSVARSRP